MSYPEPACDYNTFNACDLLGSSDGQSVRGVAHEEDSRLPVEYKGPVDVLKLPSAGVVMPALDMGDRFHKGTLRAFPEMFEHICVVDQPNVGTRADIDFEATPMGGFYLL